jgi:PAS domain S-box-containing protein
LKLFESLTHPHKKDDPKQEAPVAETAALSSVPASSSSIRPVELPLQAPQDIEGLTAENEGLRLQIKKLNRNLTALQNKLYRIDRVSGTRDQLTNYLKSEQLRQERFMAMMLQNTPDIIIMLDQNACFAYCTDAFIKALGIKSFGLIDGWHFLDVLKLTGDEGFVQSANERIQAAAESDEPQVRHELVDLSQTGDYRSFIITTAAIRNPHGVLEAYVSVFHDVTEINRARVTAEEANRTKSEFLATVSHELRTPLNAVNGLAELELRKNLPRETLNNLEKIYSSGVTLLNIINDILDISKIESGRFELLPAEYDMASIISDTISMNVVRIGSKPITFTLEASPALPSRLYGDELRVKQIMNNILSNAVKYTLEGTIVLKLTAVPSETDCWLECSVQDSGVGIREEDLEHLFSEYQQFDTASHRHIEGTGLGLFITKQLIELMNGEITVESTYGKGTTFNFRIRQTVIDDTPLGEELAHNLQTFRFFENRNRRVKEIDYIPMPFAKILVVDDVLTNLDVAKGMMAPYNMTVHSVTSGRQAIELVREAENVYDLIFMDHMMPEMDGIQAARLIREIGSNYARNVPIVALTANAIVGIENLFLENGCQGFLTKPIDVIKLDAILHKWVLDKQSDDVKKEMEKNMPVKQPSGTSPGTVDTILSEAHIEGVDLVTGIRNFNNSASIYMRIAHSFITNMPKTLDELRTVDEGSLPEYAIRVHGAKGSCYGICANDCGDAAKALEIASKAGDWKTVARDNGPFIAQVEKLIEGLKDLEAKVEAESQRQDALRPKAAALSKDTLAKLLAATQDYDIEEMQRLIDDLDSYDYEGDTSLIPWLKKQYASFSYDAIVEKLQELLQ